jgi:hypothetical protein
LYHIFIITNTISRIYACHNAVNALVPVYVPVGVAFGTARPQYIVPETLAVEVGEVRVKPFIVTALPVRAVEVPGYVNVEVENPWELVAIEFAPEASVDWALSWSELDEFPAFATTVC